MTLQRSIQQEQFMPAQFEERVVLVTGGNSEVGRASANAFAREGACVMVAARRARQGEGTVAEIHAAGASFITGHAHPVDCGRLI
jgi:NAD(P)-dependent dehydrogenase (short-subunit alcohol dehydrogenase family)